MKNIIKKILAIWISIYLIVVPPFAHAVSPAGWAFSKYDVATSVVTAMKNGASASVAVAKSPISQKIAKGIAGGVIAGVALPLALNQITGLALTAADYVLDKDNNAIRYKVPIAQMKCYKVSEPSGISTPFTSVDSACRAVTTSVYAKSVALDNEYMCQRSYNGGYESYARVILTTCPSTTQPEWRSVPIPQVADKIYDNAKTDSESRSIVNDAVKDYVNSGAADTALDAAKADADATHNCGTGTHWSGSACVADTPSTPSTPTTPDTPFDPSSILDAIGRLFDAVMSIPDVINTAIDKVLDAIASIVDVINIAIDKVINAIKDIIKPLVDLLTSFINWFKDKFTALYDAITDFFEWVKTTYDEFVKPDDSPTDVDVDVPQTPSIDTDINFGGSCPANVTGSFVIGGHTTTFNIMDWAQFCLIMSTYLKPLVIALASYQAVKILAGRNESN